MFKVEKLPKVILRLNKYTFILIYYAKNSKKSKFLNDSILKKILILVSDVDEHFTFFKNINDFLTKTCHELSAINK